jgi:hypothetical protein
MGRERPAGVLLSPFLPAVERCVPRLAAVALFHAHGDRENVIRRACALC